MSGIAGVVRLDGGPVDERDVADLGAGVAHLGPEGAGRWDGDGVTLVHAQLAATPEAVGERQPVVDRAREVSVVLDGRLDNRDELLRAISRLTGLRGPPPTTDAEILLAAYDAWGAAFVPRLLGDFAFALWDGRRRRLLCGRDHLGARPLLYRVAGQRLAWASAVKPLANLRGAPTRPNPGMVAEYLASAVTSRHETVYEGVYRVPPAHTLTAEGGSVRLDRYWDVDPTGEVRHASHAEYAEHLREVLTAAVRSRLRTVGPVAAELSGGLDSSTVVAIAQAATGDVRPLSIVYPGRACDESRWIDALAGRWALDPIKLPPQPPGSFDFTERARVTGEVPDYPVQPNWGALYGRAAGLRARCILNGIGGDECFTGTGWEAADLLRAGRIGRSVRRAQAAGGRDASSMAAVWRHAARPVLGHLLPAAVSRRLRAHRATVGAGWIPPAFARSVGLEARLRLATPPGLRTLSQDQIWYSLNSGELAASSEALTSFAGGYGLDARTPYLDRRVVELAFAVPEAERCGGDTPKRLLRTAARGLVPEQLIDRRDTPGPTYLIVQELLAPAMAPHLRFRHAGRSGWVDPGRLRAMHAGLARWHEGTQEDLHLWPLWRALAVEVWLSTMFSA
ncbi:MAG: asparagine synthase-related protein [Acidimicrobiales bacterium]